MLVAQLEHLLLADKLTLQKLVFLLLPSRVVMNTLQSLCIRLSRSVGGQLLEELHVCMAEQGDTKSREIHLLLLQKAYEPFLSMLSQWIYRGELKDPYKEFMVREDSSVTKEALQEDFNAHYWDSRYQLIDQHIPKLLRVTAIKALSAGKYLNVIRGASADVSADGEHKWEEKLLPFRTLSLSLEVTDSPMNQAIQEAYVFSSHGLLQLLEGKQYGLSSHLTSLRRFFLLEHGDFFNQFMDTAEEELRREVKDIALNRIQGLLQLAVQTSTLVQDPHREDLNCMLASHNLMQHLHLIQTAGSDAGSEPGGVPVGQGLKGVEALTLDYRVGWPVSIVLSRWAIHIYCNLLFTLYQSGGR